MAEGKKVWSDCDIKMLISLYEEHTSLWDVKSENYRNRTIKQKSLQSIAEKVNASASEVSRKLHNLRSQFMQEVRKMKTRKSGMGADEVNSPWQYFSSMKFIQGAVESSETTDNLASETAVVQDSAEITEPKSPLKKRKKSSAALPKEIQKAVNLLNQPADDEQIYGDYVASEMRQIKNPANKRRLRRMINEVIMQIADEDASESQSLQLFSLSEGSSTSSNFRTLSPVGCIIHNIDDVQ